MSSTWVTWTDNGCIYEAEAKYYLIIAPGLLTRWSSERQRAITAECYASIWQIHCTSYRASGCWKITGKRLLELLIRVTRENLFEEGLKSSFSYGFGSQINLSPSSSWYRWPSFHCKQNLSVFASNIWSQLLNHIALPDGYSHQQERNFADT